MNNDSQMKLAKSDFVRCKICEKRAEATNIELCFRESKYLPSPIHLYHCSECEFYFTYPSDKNLYKAYYNENLNDQVGLYDGLSQIDENRYAAQAKLLSPHLESNEKFTIVDIGCGRGGLLFKLKKLFPNHTYIGLDPNAKDIVIEDITFTRNENIFNQADLIIFSHVVEHIVDLNEVEKSIRKIKKGGKVYIEVPDASRYSTYPRKEFLYQIDRIHTNHFNNYSLFKLLNKNNLQCVACGQNDFEYKDGAFYPAIYMVGELSPNINSKVTPEKRNSLTDLYQYWKLEKEKAKTFRQTIGAEPIVVYGFGDNFFRSKTDSGPLDGLTVACVIDKQYKDLAQSKYSKEFSFLPIDLAIEKYKKNPFIITVSWGAQEIERNLRNLGVTRIYQI